jgi:hypothetical protein
MAHARSPKPRCREERVPTTTGRKPPLRTDKFLGFREEWLPQSLRCGVKVRRIRSLRTHRSPKRPYEQPRSGESGPKWRSQTAQAQFLASKPPILTEVFGWVWSAREHPVNGIQNRFCDDPNQGFRTLLKDIQMRPVPWTSGGRR